MPDFLTTESELAAVNLQISQRKSEASRIKKERAPFEAEVFNASWKLSNLQFRKWLRTPAESYELWRIGFLIIGSTAIGALSFIAVDSYYSPTGSALGSAGGVVCAAVLLYRLLYCPNDAELVDRLVSAEISSRNANDQLRKLQATDGLAEVEQQLRKLFEERNHLRLKLWSDIASGKRQRAALLQRNWKSMRDDEWEDYLVEVFRALGAKANRIGSAGDQGVDIIVEYGQKRIAVQAKGYYHAVSNKAVQEAYTGMRHHGCTACAVVTNSRFTKSERELAISTCCRLISEEEFPDFVIGNVKL